MWMVDPRLLCQRHLLLEHCHIHLFVSSVRKGHNIRRYLLKSLVDPSSIYKRHKELEDEIIVRGGKLDSPLSEAECIAYATWYGSTTINIGRSLADLADCCDDCCSRIGKFIYIAFSSE
jgi:hypothetical protein